MTSFIGNNSFVHKSIGGLEYLDNSRNDMKYSVLDGYNVNSRAEFGLVQNNEYNRLIGNVVRNDPNNSGVNIRVGGVTYDEDHFDFVRLGSTINLKAFDSSFNPNVAENLENVCRKLNLMTNLTKGVRFVNGGVQNKKYMNEVPEFVLFVNDNFILTNETHPKFKLDRSNRSEAELEEVARYVLRSIESGCY